MIRGIKEGFSVLKALGFKPTPPKLWYFKLPVWLTGGVFRIVMGTKLAEITMAKHCIAARQELDCLQAEFDALISQSGMKTPAIDMLKMQTSI
jgi:2-dehydropantoate 2-reductase